MRARRNQTAPLALIVALALVLPAGCRTDDHAHVADHPDEHVDEHAHDDEHGDDHTDEHGDPGADSHEHDDESISVLRWTAKLELFAEHPPAVVGEPVTLLAHITRLDGFRALEDATVTLSLEGPAPGAPSPMELLRPGVFRHTWTPERAGAHQASLVVRGADIDDVVGDFAITVHADDVAVHAAAKGSADPEDDAAIRLLKEQQWQVPFATAFAADGLVVPVVEVAGEVTTPPSGQAEVGADFAGRLVAPNGGFPRPGQTVTRGERLAGIAPAPASPELGARAELDVVEAEARVEAARAALARAERLLADRAVAPREVDEARRELRVAEESVQSARRSRDVFSGTSIGAASGTYQVTAPIDGVVVDVRASSGKSVTGGELLFRIVDLDELWIRARVPEREAAEVRADQDARFQIPGSDTWMTLDVTGSDANASVVDVGRMVDPRSRTIDVLYALRQPDARLRIGAMVRVAVPAGEPWRGVVVPRSSVLEDEGRAVVYVQVDGESFVERAVRLGPQSGDVVGIASGLRAGERVVTRGANVVRLTARAGAAPAHGHIH